MEKTSLTQKLSLIIFGLCIGIFVIEIFFRVVGFIVNEDKIKSFNQRDSTIYRVICIGDSSTFGKGASNVKKNNYPSQLQRLLDEKVKGKKFEVINLGISGINSSQVLNRFGKNILEYKPDLIIVMIGINDPWNLEESNIMRYYNASIYKKLLFSFEIMLNKLRVYQFLKLVLLSNKFNSPKLDPNAMFQSDKELVLPRFNKKARDKGFRDKGFRQFLRDPFRSIALYKSIESNIIAMKQIADNGSVNIIFMKYHNGGWGRPEKAIHQTYEKFALPVVDNFSISKEAIKIGLNIRGKDGWHPNDTGYLLIARNIFNKMVSLKIIDSEPINIFDKKR